MTLYKGAQYEVAETERSVLASTLFHYSKIESLLNIDLLEPSLFVTREAQRVFQAVKHTNLVDGKYDLVNVIGSLKKVCTGDKEFEACEKYLASLPKDVQYFQILKYLQILKANKAKNDLDKLVDEILKYRLEVDTFDDSLESWRSKFVDISSRNTPINLISAKEAIEEWDKTIKNSKKLENTSFFRTQFIDIDRRVKVLGGGQLIVLASRPGVGKTTFALNLIKNNFPSISPSKLDRPLAIGIFSLEMTTNSLLAKLTAMDAEVDLAIVQKYSDGEAISSFDFQLIEKSKNKLSKLNLLFCDDSNITLGKIISQIKAWKRKYDLKLVIVDYLQLVNVVSEGFSDGTQQYQKIGMISRSLKIAAMELNVCVFSLAQLNRKLEERRGSEKSPILSDLRESGSIEQDADVVMFLYEVPAPAQEDDEDKEKQNDNTRNTLTMLKIAKNRHGSVGTVEFTFYKNTGVFKATP